MLQLGVSFFEDLLDQILGPPYSSSVVAGEDGTVTVRFFADGVEQPGALVLEADSLVIDDELAEELYQPLAAHGAWWRKVHDYLARFPAEAERGASRTVLTLRMPSGPAWSEAGLRASILLRQYQGEELTGMMESEQLVVERSAMDGPQWDAQMDAFDARRAAWPERLDELEPRDACLALPPELDDEGWLELAEQLDLASSPPALRARIEGVLDLHPLVAARYRELYGLPLPLGVAQLAALVTSLGELPEGPPADDWETETSLGVERGAAWLYHALGMRPTGLCAWFLPGGLARRTIDTPELPGLPPGPLDPRLDLRYRRDAPQFVTFLSGDSDGLHWGLWYDSPAYYPVIASNYARDSAETWLCGTGDVLTFLARQLEQRLEEVKEAWATADDEDERRYSLHTWRALRVVMARLLTVEAVVRERPAVDEERCPWPRTSVHPVGSPHLALPPGAGEVDRHTPGVEHDSTSLADAPFESWHAHAHARAELAAGRPAAALFLGLYLHWLDDPLHRERAGHLLRDAYTALGFTAFADLLQVHLTYRDLPSVAVFAEP